MTRHRRRCTPGLHEQLGEGTVIHIVPRRAGAGKGGLQIVLGAAAIVGSFFTPGINGVMVDSALAAGGFFWPPQCCYFTWSQHDLGGVAQMLAPKAKTPDYARKRITADRTRTFLAG